MLGAGFSILKFSANLFAFVAAAAWPIVFVIVLRKARRARDEAGRLLLPPVESRFMFGIGLVMCACVGCLLLLAMMGPIYGEPLSWTDLAALPWYAALAAFFLFPQTRSRTELRENGVIWYGAFVPWSDVSRYQWLTTDPGKMLLYLHSNIIAFPVPLLAHEPLSQFLAEHVGSTDVPDEKTAPEVSPAT